MQEVVTLLYISILIFIYCFHLWFKKLLVVQKTTRTMETGIQKATVPVPHLAGNRKEDNPLSSLAICRIKGKLHLFYYFSSGLPQVISI